MAGRPARPARPADRTHATPGGAGAHLGRTGLPADRGAAAMNRQQTFVLAGVALLVLVAGFGMGWWWAGETSATSPAHSAAAPAPGGRDVLYACDLMVPDPRFDDRRKSLEMGTGSLVMG